MSSGVATRRPSCISTYRSSTSPADRCKQSTDQPRSVCCCSILHRIGTAPPILCMLHAVTGHKPAVIGRAHTHSNGRISAVKQWGEEVKGMVSSGSANLRLTGTQPQCTQRQTSAGAIPPQSQAAPRTVVGLLERPHLPAQVRLRSSGKQCATHDWQHGTPRQCHPYHMPRASSYDNPDTASAETHTSFS